MIDTLPREATAPVTKKQKKVRYGDCAGSCGRKEVRLHSLKSHMCKRCYDSVYRPNRGRWREVPVDPCPHCGVWQVEHWKCAMCGGRGHEQPPSGRQPDLCMSCARACVVKPVVARLEQQEREREAAERAERLRDYWRERDSVWNNLGALAAARA